MNNILFDIVSSGETYSTKILLVAIEIKVQFLPLIQAQKYILKNLIFRLMFFKIKSMKSNSCVTAVQMPQYTTGLIRCVPGYYYSWSLTNGHAHSQQPLPSILS